MALYVSDKATVNEYAQSGNESHEESKSVSEKRAILLRDYRYLSVWSEYVRRRRPGLPPVLIWSLCQKLLSFTFAAILHTEAKTFCRAEQRSTELLPVVAQCSEGML